MHEPTTRVLQERQKRSSVLCRRDRAGACTHNGSHQMDERPSVTGGTSGLGETGVHKSLECRSLSDVLQKKALRRKRKFSSRTTESFASLGLGKRGSYVGPDFVGLNQVMTRCCNHPSETTATLWTKCLVHVGFAARCTWLKMWEYQVTCCRDVTDLGG